MKKLTQILAVVVLLSVPFISRSQNTEKSRIYEIRNNIPIFPCDILGRRLFKGDKYQIAPFRSKFVLVRAQGGDSVIIRLLVWYKDSLNYEKYNKPVNHTAVTSEVMVDVVKFDTSKIEKYYIMSRLALDSNCVQVFNRGGRSSVFTIGLVTMPMKVRLGQNFDFQGSISLGTTAGVKMKLSKYNPNYINFLIGVSISTVSLDSFSTKGKVTGQPITNMAVFSPSLGAVFEFGKAQVGIFYGFDFLNKSTQSQYGWIYNKKPWLSFGFGFSIFNVDSQANSQTQDQNSVTSGK